MKISSHRFRRRLEPCRLTPGFTMVELLLVMTIILLLVAILLPTLQSARDTARMTQNLSNEKQIMAALHMYGSDNRNSLPYSTFDDPNPGLWAWKIMEADYLDSPFILWGPFRKRPAYFDKIMARYIGYGAANWGRGTMPYENEPSGSIPNFPPRNLDGEAANGVDPLTRRPAPANVLTIAEALSMTYWNLDGRDGFHTITNGNVLVTVNDRAAVAFLDGHGELRSNESLGWYATSMRTGFWVLTYPESRQEPWYDRR